MAIDAQLDPTASPRARERALEHAAKKIDYWQRRTAEATRYHRRRRRRELRARGVDFRRAKRCPPWPVLVELDLAGPDVTPAPPPSDLDVSL